MEAPIQFSIDEAAMATLRANKGASFETLTPLPNRIDQIGGTCGIYALDGALSVRGIPHPPPRKKFFDPAQGGMRSFRSLTEAEKKEWFKRKDAIALTSLRQQAKELGMSKVGEILSIKKLHELAVFSGAKDAKVIFIHGASDLWNAVRDAMRAKRAVVMAINGDAQYDAVLDGPTTMGHWITLIGLYENGTDRRVLSTQVGRYDLFPLYRLWRSNDSLRKWRASQFDNLELDEIQDDGTTKTYKNLIEVGDPDAEDAARCQAELHRDQRAKYPRYTRTRKVQFNEADLVAGMRHQLLVV